MSVVTVSDVVQAFSSSFKSVDLRTVAVKPKDQWMNVITSVFFGGKSQNEIKFEQQQTKEKLPKNTSDFCILLGCFSSKHLPLVFDGLKSGNIKMEGISIKFAEFNPYELRVDRYLPSYLKEMEEWRLVGAETKGTEGYKKNLWAIVDSQNGNAKLLGFKDIYELISETLRIRDFHRGRTRDVVIGIPMPARIANISLVGSSVKVKTKKVFSLEDLQLNVYIRGVNPRTNQYESIGRKTELVKKCKRPSARGFCYAKNSIRLRDLKPDDRIEVKLINRKVPTLDLDETYLRVPLQNVVEPFAKTLFSFCSLDLFRKRLLSPEDFPKSDKVFEDAAAWLLSLLGFSVTQLGEFEKLRVAETRYEIGSIDMIAHRENEYVLLVDCDTKIPDDKKIRSMTTVHKHFKFIQDEGGRPHIVCVIFSPRDCTGISLSRQDVRIVDRHRINSLLEKTMKGNTDEARTSLFW